MASCAVTGVVGSHLGKGARAAHNGAMRHIQGLAAAALAFALAGCAGGPAIPSGPPIPPVAVPTVEVTYPRTLQAARMVEARVALRDDLESLGVSDDIAVTNAYLDSPLFVTGDAWDSLVRLFPDWLKPVRLPLGEPVCPAPAGESRVVLFIDVDGRPTQQTLVVDDDAVLREINADECAQRAVLDEAAPSFGPVEEETPTEVHTSVVLTRGTGVSPVTLDSATGNIIFIVTLDETAPRSLAADETMVAVPATVTVGRCDPHAFAESKKTFVFPARLAVGQAEPAYVEFSPGPDVRAAFQRIFDACGRDLPGAE